MNSASVSDGNHRRQAIVITGTMHHLDLLSRAEGVSLAGPEAATQDMGPASSYHSCLVLQPVELPALTVHRSVCPADVGLSPWNGGIVSVMDFLTQILILQLP
ncbi:hypothetical protein GOODEAATRI_004590 [Goodea atripinnis]|uniref:Uncharacterized protein n=1 Tax=Goodea atripinnis TaxID=208336 RepID=A0ABV0MPA9_9TELE